MHKFEFSMNFGITFNIKIWLFDKPPKYLVIQDQKLNPVDYLAYETNSRLQEPSHLLRSSEYDSVCYWCWATASRYYIPK